MKKSFCIYLFIIFTGAILGCGQNHRTKSSEFGLSSEMKTVQNLAGNELTIAKRICYAYKSKSIKLRSDYNLKTFSWDLENQACDKSKTNKKINTVLKTEFGTNALVFELPAGESAKGFVSSVQTDTNGFLSTLCQKISRGEGISNTADLNGAKVQISFDQSGLDRYKIDYFSEKVTNGLTKFTIYAADIISVRTQYNWSEGQLLGGDEIITRYNQCNSSENYAIDTQKIEKVF